MRTAGLLPLCLLLACAPTRPGDDDDGGCETALQVCVFFGTIEEPATGGAVRVLNPDDETPLESLVGADGCVTIDLTEGIWQWQASNQAGDCVSAWEEVTVDTCSTVIRSVDLTSWCFDGDARGR